MPDCLEMPYRPNILEAFPTMPQKDMYTDSVVILV